LSKDTSAARGAPSATAGASFFAVFAAFGAFVGAGAAAGASRTIGFAAAGFVSRSAASWRWNSVRPAAGPAAFVVEAGASATASSAKTLTGAAATPASATPAASVPSCLLRACVGVALRRRRRVYGVQAHASEQMRRRARRRVDGVVRLAIRIKSTQLRAFCCTLAALGLVCGARPLASATTSAVAINRMAAMALTAYGGRMSTAGRGAASILGLKA
jgi:hypothetical protein